MAFIRQKGGPSLFATFSAAEFAWDHLALRIYETVTRSPSTLEFITSQPISWRNKLIQENVVQTTLHFNKRIEKIISYLNKSNLVEHEGIQYTLSSYFYRIEFQVFNSLLYITMGVFNFNYQIKVCKRNSFYFLTNIIDKVELELSFQL